MLPHIERGLRHGEGDTITAEFIRLSLLAGEMQAWAISEKGCDGILAVLVFRILCDERGRRLYVVMLAGVRMAEWVEEVEQMLIDYKDIIGARCIRASCRVGLARILGKRGWTRQSVIMEAPDGR